MASRIIRMFSSSPQWAWVSQSIIQRASFLKKDSRMFSSSPQRLSQSIMQRASFLKKDKSATPENPSMGKMRVWRGLALGIGLPVVFLLWINAYVLHAGHTKRPEFRKWEHLRLRTTKFPWGDGNHGLLHHCYFNALPEGYEDLRCCKCPHPCPSSCQSCPTASCR